MKKREKWLSEKEATAKWTEKELELHIASGRVQWRECPDTWDVYEYLDTKDFEKSSVGKNKSAWQYGQEYEMEAEDEDEWGANFEKDLHSLTLEGLGKGKALSLDKGKGKGKGKGKHRTKDEKPLEDDKTREEDQGDVAEHHQQFRRSLEKGGKESLPQQAEPQGQEAKPAVHGGNVEGHQKDP